MNNKLFVRIMVIVLIAAMMLPTVAYGVMWLMA